MKKHLYRSRKDKKIFGICGGIAEYFNIDATIIRLAIAALAIFTPFVGDGILLYIIAAFVLPVSEETNNEAI